MKNQDLDQKQEQEQQLETTVNPQKQSKKRKPMLNLQDYQTNQSKRQINMVNLNLWSHRFH